MSAKCQAMHVTTTKRKVKHRTATRTPSSGCFASSGRQAPRLSAERSAGARRKASRKRTTEGLPLHSFRTLLTDLATLTRNRCVQPQVAPEHEFTMLSTPTPLQQRALELLRLSSVP